MEILGKVPLEVVSEIHTNSAPVAKTWKNGELSQDIQVADVEGVKFNGAQRLTAIPVARQGILEILIGPGATSVDT